MRNVALAIALVLIGTGASLGETEIKRLDKKSYYVVCIEGYKYVRALGSLAPKYNKRREPEKCYKKPVLKKGESAIMD